MSLDPTAQWLLRIALSLLFARAAAHKLADVGAFRRAFEAYGVVPAAWSVLAGAALIGLECAIAVGLWLPRVATAAALAAAALLALYGGAMGLALARGRRDLDCGCTGPAARQPVRASLVARNALLALAALLAALPATARDTGWVDALTVAGGVVVAAFFYLASEGLGAAAPRAEALRRARQELARA
ncbi:MAG: MauE/DoxX family redox-associated membrane protein [Deltaproteobacteria bacterium]|nr:MauE/DoxX family redox-associated membrane protein [Deltaproteobacteria bacterium]